LQRMRQRVAPTHPEPGVPEAPLEPCQHVDSRNVIL
jgi:hypothetical protein